MLKMRQLRVKRITVLILNIYNRCMTDIEFMNVNFFYKFTQTIYII